LSSAASSFGFRMFIIKCTEKHSECGIVVFSDCQVLLCLLRRLLRLLLPGWRSIHLIVVLSLKLGLLSVRVGSRTTTHAATSRSVVIVALVTPAPTAVAPASATVALLFNCAFFFLLGLQLLHQHELLNFVLHSGLAVVLVPFDFLLNLA
jgi:hypothetical protein